MLVDARCAVVWEDHAADLYADFPARKAGQETFERKESSRHQQHHATQEDSIIFSVSLVVS